MKETKYDDFQKRNILLEKLTEGTTIRSICHKYNITPPTFYAWKNKFGTEQNLSEKPNLTIFENSNIERENKILKQLYINLSAHNYELAKFLEK